MLQNVFVFGLFAAAERLEMSKIHCIALASARPQVGWRSGVPPLPAQASGRPNKAQCAPPHMFEWAIAIRDDSQQTLAIFGRRKDTDGLSHAHRIIRLCQCTNDHPVRVLNILDGTVIGR